METSSRKPIIMEINLISAQDLRRGRRSSATQRYVVAYLNPNLKLTSRIVEHSHCHTWNDKFIFVLESDDHLTNNSCIVFEIFRVRRFVKDKRIGVVRVLLDSLISKDHGRSEAEGPKFAAFHVRTPAGEPMGILNIGVATLNVMFHQQLSKFLSSVSAVDHRTLMGGEQSSKSCRGTIEKSTKHQSPRHRNIPEEHRRNRIKARTCYCFTLKSTYD